MTISFKPLEESDFSLLCQWLQLPHVKVGWDPKTQWDLNLVREHFGSYVNGYKLDEGERKTILAFVILQDNQRIGYVQVYNAHDFKREGNLDLKELPDSLAAFDILIGVKEAIGKGLGTQITEKFLSLFIDPYYEYCFVDPQTANKAAVRMYEKVGFRSIKKVLKDSVVWMLREKRHK